MFLNKKIIWACAQNPECKSYVKKKSTFKLVWTVQLKNYDSRRNYPTLPHIKYEAKKSPSVRSPDLQALLDAPLGSARSVGPGASDRTKKAKVQPGDPGRAPSAAAESGTSSVKTKKYKPISEVPGGASATAAGPSTSSARPKKAKTLLQVSEGASFVSTVTSTSAKPKKSATLSATLLLSQRGPALRRPPRKRVKTLSEVPGGSSDSVPAGSSTSSAVIQPKVKKAKKTKKT